MTRGRVVMALVAALVVLNLAMLLVFVGAAGSVQQARRALDPGSLGACATEAGEALGWPVGPATDVRFAGADTVRFEVTERDGRRTATVDCRFAPPDPDDSGPLPVRDVAVSR